MNQTDKPGPCAPDDESTVAEVRRRYAAFAGDGSSYSSSSCYSSAQLQPTAIIPGGRPWCVGMNSTPMSLTP